MNGSRWVMFSAVLLAGCASPDEAPLGERASAVATVEYALTLGDTGGGEPGPTDTSDCGEGGNGQYCDDKACWCEGKPYPGPTDNPLPLAVRLGATRPAAVYRDGTGGLAS